MLIHAMARRIVVLHAIGRSRQLPLFHDFPPCALTNGEKEKELGRLSPNTFRIMKTAICNETFQNWDWAETCRQVAESGYDGIEVAPFTLTEDVRSVSSQARRDYADTAQRAGLSVVGLHWLLVSPKGLSVTSREEKVRLETSNYLAALVDFCADLGGRIMVFGSPAQRRIPEGEDASVAAERLQACLEPALARAESQKITLCLEPLPGPEADFILTLREAVTLVQKFDHPALKTIFDVKSASSEKADLSDLIHEFAPWIAHVHANDANRRGPGFGSTDFVPILSALRSVGYQDYISIEVFDYSPDPITIARESLAYLKRCEASAQNG
jgi:sugar phosphate isomerase/epimerase